MSAAPIRDEAVVSRYAIATLVDEDYQAQFDEWTKFTQGQFIEKHGYIAKIKRKTTISGKHIRLELELKADAVSPAGQPSSMLTTQTRECPTSPTHQPRLAQ